MLGSYRFQRGGTRLLAPGCFPNGIGEVGGRPDRRPVTALGCDGTQHGQDFVVGEKPAPLLHERGKERVQPALRAIVAVPRFPQGIEEWLARVSSSLLISLSIYMVERSLNVRCGRRLFSLPFFGRLFAGAAGNFRLGRALRNFLGGEAVEQPFRRVLNLAEPQQPVERLAVAGRAHLAVGRQHLVVVGDGAAVFIHAAEKAYVDLDLGGVQPADAGHEPRWVEAEP